MLIGPTMPSSPSPLRMVRRSQRPPGTEPQARSPRGLQARVRVRLVSAALSSRKTKRSGAMPAAASRQFSRSSPISGSSLSAARSVFFFAREPETLQGSAEGPGVDPYPDRLRQPVPVLGQAQMVVGPDPALERGLALTPDRGRWAAVHRL